jgi:protein-tyrosine phosphatase
MHDPRRILDFPSLHNVRDLGGYPTSDGGTTRWRSVLRADDLVHLTPAGLQALLDFGLRSVIDLRWPEEVAAHPNPLMRTPIHYRHISLLTHSQQNWGELSGPASREEWNRLVLIHTRPQLQEVLQAIAAAPPGPLLFHCVAGKDRTGVVAALLLALADATADAIAHDYSMSAECLRESYLIRHARRDLAETLEALRCPPEGAHNVLEYVGRHGGIRAFLEQIGLSQQEIARLRARLRD